MDKFLEQFFVVDRNVTLVDVLLNFILKKITFDFFEQIEFFDDHPQAH
jgi:hypothetical protein